MGLAAIALGKYLWPNVIAMINLISKNSPHPQTSPAAQCLSTTQLREVRAIVMECFEEIEKKKRQVKKKLKENSTNFYLQLHVASNYRHCKPNLEK